MYRLFPASIETLAAAMALIPLFLYLNRWLFPTLRRTAACCMFSLYLSAVYALAGLPNILYIRPDPNFNFRLFAYMFSDLDATLLNVLLFIPLGLALPLLWKRFGFWWRTALFGLSASVFIEVLQIFTHRATDVNDLLTNTLGCLLGFGLAKVVLRFAPQLPSDSKKELPIICLLTFLVLFLVQPFLSGFLWNSILL